MAKTCCQGLPATVFRGALSPLKDESAELGLSCSFSCRRAAYSCRLRVTIKGRLDKLTFGREHGFTDEEVRQFARGAVDQIALGPRFVLLD